MSQKKAKQRGTISRRITRLEAERRRAARRRRLVRSAQIGVPIVVLGAGLILVLLLRGDGGTAESSTAVTDIPKSSAPTTTTAPPPPTITPTVTACDQKSGELEGKPQYATPPVQSIDPAKTYIATIETTSGTIVAELSPTAAPVTVNSFVFLARCGFYDQTTIHRVAKDFVIQGGDPTGTGTGGPGYKLPDELPAAPGYPIGSLAMANSGPHTSGSQFFIVTGPSATTLPSNYTLFGRVTLGQDVAKTIEQIPSEGNEKDGKPSLPVTISRITIEER